MQSRLFHTISLPKAHAIVVKIIQVQKKCIPGHEAAAAAVAACCLLLMRLLLAAVGRSLGHSRAGVAAGHSRLLLQEHR